MRKLTDRKKRSNGTPKGHTRMAFGLTLEKRIRKIYERSGWTVLQGGWPDMLAFRRHDYDNGFDVQRIESKAGTSTLRKHQKAIHTALRELGFPVIIERGEFKGRPWLKYERRQWLTVENGKCQ